MSEEQEPTFAGMPVKKALTALVQASRIYSEFEKVPSYNDNVTLRVDGRVKGTKAIDGVLTVLVEVLDAEYIT